MWFDFLLLGSFLHLVAMVYILYISNLSSSCYKSLNHVALTDHHIHLLFAEGMIFIWKHDKEKDNANAFAPTDAAAGNLLDDKLPDKVCAHLNAATFQFICIHLRPKELFLLLAYMYS